MKITNKVIILALLLVSITIVAQKAPLETLKINQLLDSWHRDAANADFESYFEFMAKDAIYIGTDATEHWDVTEFKKFAKPFFNRGKAWRFTPIERHLYTDASGTFVWFDELLDTQMQICRGSGVLMKENGVWKLKQYVLSMTIPNADVDAVVTIKKPFEQLLIQRLSTK